MTYSHKSLLLLVGLLCSFSLHSAPLAQQALGVQAQVSDICVFNSQALDVAFNYVDASYLANINSPGYVTATSNISINCTTNLSAQLIANDGLHADPSSGLRRMSSGTNYLTYEICLNGECDPGVRLGNGGATGEPAAFIGTGFGGQTVAFDQPLWIEIYMNGQYGINNAPSGTYTDTVQLTVEAVS